MSTHKTGCFYRAEITTEQGTAGRPCVHPAPRSPTAWSPAQGAESWIPILRVQSHLQLCSSWLLQRTSASQLALTTASMLAALSPPSQEHPLFFFPSNFIYQSPRAGRVFWRGVRWQSEWQGQLWAWSQWGLTRAISISRGRWADLARPHLATPKNPTQLTQLSKAP